jgi:hypothetical protein
MSAARREEFEWTAHPARERPWTALGVLVAIVVVPPWLIGFEESFAWSLFAAVLLVLSLHRFYFATYYAMTEEGLTARSLAGRRSVRWGDVTRLEVGRSAAWLSAARGPGWREQRRGVLILFGRQREEVLRRLKERLPAGALNSPSSSAGAPESKSTPS